MKFAWLHTHACINTQTHTRKDRREKKAQKHHPFAHIYTKHTPRNITQTQHRTHTKLSGHRRATGGIQDRVHARGKIGIGAVLLCESQNGG